MTTEQRRDRFNSNYSAFSAMSKNAPSEHEGYDESQMPDGYDYAAYAPPPFDPEILQLPEPLRSEMQELVDKQVAECVQKHMKPIRVQVRDMIKTESKNIERDLQQQIKDSAARAAYNQQHNIKEDLTAAAINIPSQVPGPYKQVNPNVTRHPLSHMTRKSTKYEEALQEEYGGVAGAASHASEAGSQKGKFTPSKNNFARSRKSHGGSQYDAAPEYGNYYTDNDRAAEVKQNPYRNTNMMKAYHYGYGGYNHPFGGAQYGHLPPQAEGALLIRSKSPRERNSQVKVVAPSAVGANQLAGVAGIVRVKDPKVSAAVDYVDPIHGHKDPISVSLQERVKFGGHLTSVTQNAGRKGPVNTMVVTDARGLSQTVTTTVSEVQPFFFTLKQQAFGYVPTKKAIISAEIEARELQYNKVKFRGPIGTGKKGQSYMRDHLVHEQVRMHEETIRRDRDISTIQDKYYDPEAYRVDPDRMRQRMSPRTSNSPRSKAEDNVSPELAPFQYVQEQYNMHNPNIGPYGVPYNYAGYVPARKYDPNVSPGITQTTEYQQQHGVTVDQGYQSPSERPSLAKQRKNK